MTMRSIYLDLNFFPRFLENTKCQTEKHLRMFGIIILLSYKLLDNNLFCFFFSANHQSCNIVRDVFKGSLHHWLIGLCLRICSL